MGLTTQIIQFIGVSAAFVIFSLIWAWYKARQKAEEDEEDFIEESEFGGEE